MPSRNPISCNSSAAEHRRLAALEDVDQRRAAHLPADDPQFLDRLRRLDEPDIGAGFEIGVDPVDRGLQPLDSARVRTGNDDQVGIAPGIDRSLDLADHFRSGNDFFPFVMAALLRRDLILDMEPGDPGFLVLAHGADHIDRVAVAGIGVGDDRDRDGLDRQPDKADILDHR